MEIDAILKSFQRFGISLGLERIHQLLKNLGSPHLRVPVIHVAGTNGKGSVCAYLSSVLTEAGYTTGRYTSPHLVDWTERISLNEKPISHLDLQELLSQVKAAVKPDEESPTQFEVITAAAWLYFAQRKVDIAIIEVGLGGRLDATNVCPQALVSIITSISKDHLQQLGSTIADIAREKSGIIKSGCPVVIGQLSSDAKKVVITRAQQLNCDIYIPEPAQLIESSNQAEYQSIINSNSLKYPLALRGQIQLANSVLAITALEILQNQGWQKITQQAIIQGMAKTKWLGRLQWTTWNCDGEIYQLLLDGAHNPAGAEALRNYVDTLNVKSVTWVVGILSTKEYVDVLKALLRPNDRLYLVPVPDDKTAKPNELAKQAKQICPELSFCHAYSDLKIALNAAFAVSNMNYFYINDVIEQTSKDLVILCGSLYLIGHFMAMDKGN